MQNKSSVYLDAFIIFFAFYFPFMAHKRNKIGDMPGTFNYLRGTRGIKI